MNALVDVLERPEADAAAPPAPRSPDLYELRDGWIAFRRHRGRFMGALIAVLALVALATMLMTPVYTSTASVMLDTRRTEIVDIQAVLSGPGFDASLTDTEAQVISSRALVQRVAERLALFDDPEFNAALEEPSPFDAVADGIKRGLSVLRSLFGSSMTDAGLAERMARAKVLDRVMEALEVRRAGITYVINISATTRVPEKSVRLANAVAEEYIRQQLEAKTRATQGANQWLDQQLTALRTEVRQAEAAVEEYRRQSGLLSAKGTTLTEQQIAELNAQLVMQRSEFLEREARLGSVQAQLAAGGGADSLSEVLSSDVIRNLRTSQAERSRRIADLEARYGQKHPEFVNAQREAADLQRQIDQEVARIVGNLESEVGVARTRVASLSASLAGAQAQLSGNNRSEVKLRELEREAAASRDLYESFLRRSKQTGDQAEILQPDAHIVSEAQLASRASAPNRLLNLVLGLVLGCAAGVALVVLAELSNRRLRSGHEVERRVDARHLGTIPRFARRPNLVERWTGRRPRAKAPVHELVVEKPRSAIAEAVRSIRSALRHAHPNDVPRIIAVTASLPGEEHASIALALGRMAALSGARAIIVDADLRMRELTRLAAFTPKAGLVEALHGDATIAECIVQDAKTPLAVLPLTAAAPPLADLLGSRIFGVLLEKLAEHYDAIFLSLSPVLAVSDAQSAARHADATIVAARWNATSCDAVQSSLETLRRAGVPIAGVVLADADALDLRRYAVRDPVSRYAAECRESFAA